MKLDQNSNWVLSAIELRLAMQIFGKPDWAEVPVFEDGRSLEQRMLEAFVHMAEIGFLEYTPSGYRSTQNMKAFLHCLAQPERVVAGSGESVHSAAIYLSVGQAMMLQAVPTDEEHFRVSPVQPEEWAEQFVQALVAVDEEISVRNSKANIWIFDKNGALLRRIGAEQGKDGRWLATEDGERWIALLEMLRQEWEQ